MKVLKKENLINYCVFFNQTLFLLIYMENSTNIDNLKQDNSTEINNIIQQIEKDNDTVKQAPNVQFQEQPQYQEEQLPLQNEPIEINASMTDILLHEFKGTLTFIILFILFSINNVDELMGSYLSFVWGDDRLNMFGVAIKAVIGGVLFYILNKFVL